MKIAPSVAGFLSLTAGSVYGTRAAVDMVSAAASLEEPGRK